MSRSQEPTLVVEVSHKHDHVEVCVLEGFDLQTDTAQHYESKKIEWEEVYRNSLEVFHVMSTFNRDGRLAGQSLLDLKRLGTLLFDEIFPVDTKEQILDSTARNLVVRIDNGLVRIPWELLYDGESFFCLRWDMGRLVKTQQRVHKSPRSFHLPLKMLLVADPRGDLPAAYREGQLVRDMLDDDPGKIEPVLLSHKVSVRAVKERLKECEIVHYAGHADYLETAPSESGWLLEDGKISAAQISQMAGGRDMPALVFVNACMSGQTTEWKVRENRSEEIFGLANAFLVAGSTHYIGTFWEVQDEPSNHLAVSFYKFLAEGHPVGSSLRMARNEIIRSFGESAIVWATYMLYGDPSFAYIKEQRPHENAERSEAVGRRVSGLHQEEALRMRGGGEGISAQAGISRAEQPDECLLLRRNRLTVPVILSVCLVSFLCVLAALFVYKHVGRGATSPLATAEDFVENADTEALRRKYENALESRQWSNEERAKLHGLLGRIYAHEGDLEQAISHYEEALVLDPEDRLAKSNLCVAFNRLGRYKEAGDCAEGLLAMAPRDELALVLRQKIEERVAFEKDQLRIEEINALVDRLSRRKGSSPEDTPGPEKEPWTSRPLTMTILSMEGRGGLSLRDGENEALLDILTNKLKHSTRVQIIDRLLLDKALEELDLGSGKLADPAFSLQLGRIISARILGQGSVYRGKDSMQIHLRLIETETTSLRAALVKSFPKETALDEVGSSLADAVVSEIRASYPLRGEVISADGPTNIVVNIGQHVGLEDLTIFNVLPPNTEDPRFAFAHLKITSIEADRAKAEAVEPDVRIDPGCRVVESSETLQ